MLKQVLSKLSSLCAQKAPFDQAALNDPLAQQIAWTPVKRGGANFRTHRLVEINPSRMEFRPTVGSLIFGGFFAVIGACVFVFPLGSVMKSRHLPSVLDVIFPMLFGLIFMTVGVLLIRWMITPVVIDKEEKAVWKGKKSPREVFNVSELKGYAEIKTIHALQLVAEYCRGNKSSYTSYELNLVLEDGRRLNLVDHGNRQKLIEDAQTLAGFLGVPLWNAL